MPCHALPCPSYCYLLVVTIYLTIVTVLKQKILVALAPSHPAGHLPQGNTGFRLPWNLERFSILSCPGMKLYSITACDLGGRTFGRLGMSAPFIAYSSILSRLGGGLLLAPPSTAYCRYALNPTRRVSHITNTPSPMPVPLRLIVLLAICST